MIRGIGVDLVHVPRLARGLARFPARYARRILTERELDVFASSRHPARYLAKRFAAKEAVAKAVGTGLRHPVTLRDIGVVNDELGRPVLEFSERLEKHLQAMGIGQAMISLSDENDYAIAYVVLFS